jgi:hypothetical protein
LLSINLAKKHAKAITINTDKFGKEILNSICNDVEIIENLNRFDNLDINRWSIPKIYIINFQKVDFCHIDHDVFLFKEPPVFSNVDFVSQEIEDSMGFQSFYKDLYLNYINNNNNKISEIFIEAYNQHIFGGINCGYLDFKNLDIAKEWSNFAINVNDLFVKNFRWIDCCLVEQFTLYVLYKKHNYNIRNLFNNPVSEELRKKNSLGYVHLMTGKNEKTFKKTISILKKDCNLEYEKLISVQNKFQSSLV